MGRNGAEEIKNHPFFEGMNWSTLKQLKAPYMPSVTSEISTENFDKFDEEEPFFVTDKNFKKSKKLDMNFIGYTYKADVENEKCMLVNVLKDLDSIQENPASNSNSSKMKAIDNNKSVISRNQGESMNTSSSNNGGTSYRGGNLNKNPSEQ